MVGLLRRFRQALARLRIRQAVVRFLPDRVRRSYRWKFVVVLALIVLLSSAVSLFFFVGIGDTLDRQVNTEVRATTQMHATIYSSWFTAREQQLRSIATNEYMAGGSLDRASRRLGLEAARSSIYTDLHLLDTETGDVIASSEQSTVGENYYELAVNESFVTGGREFVHPRRISTFDGTEVVTLVIRLRSADRVLVAEVPPDAGPAMPQPSKGASTRLVNRDGNVLFGPSNISSPPTNVSWSVVVQRNDASLHSYRNLPGSALIVARQTPVQQAFGVKQDVLVSFGSTVLVNAGILVVIGLISGRAATDHLQELVGKAKAMAAGNLQVDLSTSRKDEIGQLYAAFADMRDALRRRIEESESARAEAQAARDEVQEQKAIISVLNRVLRHNLRNDLVVIDGHTSVLEEKLDEESREHAAIIDSRTDDMLDKAEKARQIERLVGEDQQLQPIDAVGILETELDRFGREHPEATITADLPSQAVVKAHDALGFVFSNLIENAIGHNDATEPTVDVSVRTDDADDQWVEIEIADDGPGIPDSEVESLQAGYETAVKHGSGLGLWLVNWLVDEMGGTLAFESRNPSGTVVTVRLHTAVNPTTVEPPVESE